jgi:hypothetical protein
MTFVTQRHIPRRRFLKGVGTAIAVPFLDAMVPAFSRAATKAPVRMAFLYVPNGIIMKQWTHRQRKGVASNSPGQRGGLAGIPFQAPWTNRLDEPAF